MSIADSIRAELGDAATLTRVVQLEEVGYVVGQVDGTFTVAVRNKNVKQIIGVWLYTDTNFTGTNYYVGSGGTIEDPNGSFDAKSGLVTLSDVDVIDTKTKVVTAYEWEEGISDADVDLIYTRAQMQIKAHVNDFTISFSGGSKYQWAAEAVAKFVVLLALNGSSVIQQGYNFRIEELSIETKAWGEGMIAQFLLTQYAQEVEEAKRLLGYGVRFTMSKSGLQKTAPTSRAGKTSFLGGDYP